jgi:hypothetical protein
MKKEIIINLILTISAVLFLYASFSKYADWAQFGNSMHKQPFPEWMIGILMWSLPPIEIIIAALLLGGLFNQKLRILGLYAFELTMALFTFYIVAILLNLFPRVPCSCGGVLQSLGWVQHLVFNLFFMLLSAFGIYLYKRQSRLLG